MRLLPLYDVITSPEEYVTMSWMSLYNSFRAQNNFADKMSSKQDAAKKASKALYGAAGLPLGYNLWDAKGEYLINDGLAAYGYANPVFDPTISRRPGYENIESWADEIFRIGQKMEANVKFSGGSEKVNYFTSLGYLKDEGYYQSSDYSRVNLRSNLDFKPKKWLKGNLNIAYSYSDMNSPNQDGGGAMNNGFYYVNAIPAIYPVFLRDENGNTYTDPRTGFLAYDYGDGLNRPFGFGINPAGSLYLDKEKYVSHNINVQGGLNFTLYKGLKLMIDAGVYYNGTLASMLTNMYYGDEASLDGDETNEGCRHPMPWDKDFESTDQFKLYQTLCHLKTSEDSLINGGYKFLDCHDYVFSFIRFNLEEGFVTVFARNDEEVTITLPLADFGFKLQLSKCDVFGNELNYTVEDEVVKLVVKPHTSLLIKVN
jgi:hypothetical protein